MKIVTRFAADDGKLFSTEDACLEHEARCRAAAAATRALEAGATLADAMSIIDPGYAAAFPVLACITKATGISVPHWQCRDDAGYHVIAIDADRCVHLYGDAGSWSGPYGNWISVRDLVRYAERTPGIASLLIEGAVRP